MGEIRLMVSIHEACALEQLWNMKNTEPVGAYADFSLGFVYGTSEEGVRLVASATSLPDPAVIGSEVERFAHSNATLREKICVLLWMLVNGPREGRVVTSYAHPRMTISFALQNIIGSLTGSAIIDGYGVRPQADVSEVAEIVRFVLRRLAEAHIESSDLPSALVRAACKDGSVATDLLEIVTSSRGLLADLALFELYVLPTQSARDALVTIWGTTPNPQYKCDVGLVLQLHGDNRAIDLNRELLRTTQRTSRDWIRLIVSTALAGDSDSRRTLRSISNTEATSSEHQFLRHMLTGRWASQLMQDEYWRELLANSDAIALPQSEGWLEKTEP